MSWSVGLRRSSVMVLVFVLFAGLFFLLDGSDWAESQRLVVEAEHEHEERELPAGLTYVLPFFKVLVLTGVPMMLVLASKWITGRWRSRNPLRAS